MKHATATRLAPLTAALAIVPPVPLPNLSWPATRTATLVDEAGMKIDCTSRPYFLYSPFSWAMYQLALGASTELYETVSFSWALSSPPNINTAIMKIQTAPRDLFVIIDSPSPVEPRRHTSEYD